MSDDLLHNKICGLTSASCHPESSVQAIVTMDLRGGVVTCAIQRQQ